MSHWKEFESKSTEELIEAFQNTRGNKLERDNAFFALFYRFRSDVIQKCEILCNRFGHSANTAELIAENTFKSYAKKGKFNHNEGKGKTIDHSFKIYLYGIIRNELTNYFKEEEKKAKGQYYDGTEKIITELPSIDIDKLDLIAKVRYQIIQSLPPSHRTVYLTYQAYEKLGCNLPRKLTLELRNYLGISQTTIRSYKKEANDKIKEGLKIMNLTLNSDHD